MDIIGKIIGIKYTPLLKENLQQIEFKSFDINNFPSTGLLKTENSLFAISKWVSPKRTRSYPFERVYNSLGTTKKITIIPIIKDEGAIGDRDFIQWDTISLMSLLDVFVIFGYYHKTEVNPKNKEKITNQQFDNDYVIKKIKEIEQYHSSALHWNLNELNANFRSIISLVKKSYSEIEKATQVQLHSLKGIETFKEKIGEDISLFMDFSRDKAKKAQSREIATIQPKERLSSLTKAKITIYNYLGGKYFLTVDEVKIEKDIIYLIEGKHSKSNILPSKSDIKDGLLKMILYSNFIETKYNSKKMKSLGVLLLTSSKLKGEINSTDSNERIKQYIKDNKLSNIQSKTIRTLINEAIKNNFIVKLQYSK